MKKCMFLAAFLLAGCVPGTGASMPGAVKENEMPIRYLALGDSYTIGESAAENERFPNQLASLLTQEGYAAEVTLIARTGWTTSELWAGIQMTHVQPPYDFVSLLIGVNNQYRGHDLEHYRDEFRLLLEKSIEFAGGETNRVFVLSIPDWGVTPFAAGRDQGLIAHEVDLFNAVNREETEKAGAHYVDITAISRRAVKDRSLVANDGLHPSGIMYGLWVEMIYPQVIEALK